jgi:hypothetical protein
LPIVDRSTPIDKLLKLRLDLVEATHLLLCVLLIVPKVGLSGELLEILLPGIQCRNVKDSPGHGPGGQ